MGIWHVSIVSALYSLNYVEKTGSHIFLAINYQMLHSVPKGRELHADLLNTTSFHLDWKNNIICRAKIEFLFVCVVKNASLNLHDFSFLYNSKICVFFSFEEDDGKKRVLKKQ